MATLSTIPVTDEMRKDPTILPDIPRYLYQVYVNEADPKGAAIYKRLIREVIFLDSPNNSPLVEYKISTLIPVGRHQTSDYITTSMVGKKMSWAKLEENIDKLDKQRWAEYKTYQYLALNETEACEVYESFLKCCHCTWEEEADKALSTAEEFQIRLAEFAKYKDIIIF